jgi:hypothetical protein
MLPIIVAQIFIGVRPEESLRLDTSQFDFGTEEVNIFPDIAEGGEKHARINKIAANALMSLQPYFLKSKEKVLTGVNSKSAFDDRSRKLREDAGWPLHMLPLARGAFSGSDLSGGL